MTSCRLDAEEGFALPSVLFLLTILSLLALSILSLNYLRRQAASLEVSRMKADYAAQSGLVQVLAGDSSKTASTSYTFADESSSTTTSSRWGLLDLVRARGSFRTSTSEHLALVGARTSRAFDQALVYASPDHQLVFAGSATIEGDVEVGQAGVTTGTLKDYKTPRTIPVKGKVYRTEHSVFPQIDYNALGAIVTGFENVLSSSGPAMSGSVLDLSTISDTVRLIKLKGPVVIKGSISRRGDPLVIAAQGRVILARGATMRKLVAIASTEAITLSAGIEVDQAILYSRTSIEILPGARASAQFIAAVVHVDSAAALGYPSIILNFQRQGSSSQKLETYLEATSSFEGTIIQTIDNQCQQNGSGVVLKGGSLVTGAVVTENRLTLDGEVRGTVITRDFYFYEAPTHYYGWMRRGSISRMSLPKGFLLPLVFQDAEALDLLDWL